MDLTSQTSILAAATADVARLLPARAFDPVLSGLLLTADADGAVLAATDRERSVRLRRAAVVHDAGSVLVPGRPLAETLKALDVPDVRLAVEGARLVVRTPRARFALPLLEVDLHPGVADAPALAGHAAGGPLLRGLGVVAGAASRDDALPLFSGVHMRSSGDVLRLVATDRYRLAVAQLPWRPAGEAVDVLIPGVLAGEVARQAAGAGEVALRVDADRAVLAWAGAEVGTALLATPFPDEGRYLDLTGDATVAVPADDLLGAVRRVGLFADGRGAVGLDVADGEVRVRASGADLGEADESVKATVTGALTQTYRVRYLVDALRVFAGRQVRLAIRSGLRATALTAVEPDSDGLALTYVVMPILTD